MYMHVHNMYVYLWHVSGTAEGIHSSPKDKIDHIDEEKYPHEDQEVPHLEVLEIRPKTTDDNEQKPNL